MTASNLSQPKEKRLPVIIRLENILTAVTARHHMVNRTFRRRGRASFHLENRAPASPFGDQAVAFEHLAHRADGRSRFSVQIRRSTSSEVRQVTDFGARLRSSKAFIPPSA